MTYKKNNHFLHIAIVVGAVFVAALSFLCLSLLYPIKVVAAHSASAEYSDPSSLFCLEPVTFIGGRNTIDSKYVSATEHYNSVADTYELRLTYRSYPPVACFVYYDYSGGHGTPAAPLRDGFVFLEWVKDEKTNPNNIYLYALWLPDDTPNA